MKIDKRNCNEFDISTCCRPIENPADCEEPDPGKGKGKTEPEYIYWDTETYTDKSNKHIPYLVCAKDKHGCKSFESKYWLEEFLNYLGATYGSTKFDEAPKLVLYAHNVTYDGAFMLKHLMTLQTLEKDNTYVCMKGDYCCWENEPKKFVKLLIKDSYTLIPVKLADIPKRLDFEDMAQKEVMYYDMYNHNTLGHITTRTQEELGEYITGINDSIHEYA